MVKRGIKILGNDILFNGLLNLTDRKIADRIMSKVVGSSLDALERSKAKEKSRKISPYTVQADTLVSSIVFQAGPNYLMLPPYRSENTVT